MPKESPTGEVTPRKIRVLIADDRPETQQSLRKLLQFEGDIEVVGSAASGEEAIQATHDLRPDIVLMDISMPGMDGITATELITKQYPYAQIVMMSVHTDADSVRRSMLAGARDFIVKPFTTNALTASVRRVYELEAQRRAAFEQATAVKKVQEVPKATAGRGRLITVFSPKGGTGSSTVAVNLAIALQKLGHKVALVDANLQFGDVAILLNLQPTHSMADLVPEINELDPEMIDSVMATHSSGIRVLLAPSRPELSELLGPQDIRTIEERLLAMFDYVVVDTKGFLYDVVLTLLDLSDRILLVATPDIPSVKSIRLFFDVTDALNYPRERTCLIINMADRRGAIDTADIESSIKQPVVMSLPMEDPGAVYAANEGIPLVINSRKSAFAQVISELAAWLVEELTPKPAKEIEPEKQRQQRGKLFGRIF